MSGISILAVDDEVPSLDELSYLLDRSPLVGRVEVARSAADAIRHLQGGRFDAVLLDVRMPGLSGMELARVLGRFARPPAIVFVTAHEDYAVEAFEVGATGYLLKPVHADRLERVLRRVAPPGPVGAAAPLEPADAHASAPDAHHGSDVVAVDAGNRTRLVPVSDIAWVESAGDYVRLHLRDSTSHLVRSPMSVLEEEWSDRGFVRIHRSYLVSLHDVTEVRADGAHTEVQVRDAVLPVSRRHVRDLRDRLVRHARPRVH